MERHGIYRYAVALALLAAAIFLLLSIASHSPHDPPARFADAPLNAEPTNMCGVVGAYIAFAARFFLGTGAYIFAIAVGALGAALLVRGTIEDLWVRVIGVALVVVSWCAAAAMIFPTGEMPGANGGFLGLLFDEYVHTRIGTGAYIVVLLGLAVGALLAADAWVLWMGKKGVELVTMQGLERPARAEPTPPAKVVPADHLAEQKELLRKRVEERHANARKKPAEAEPDPDKTIEQTPEDIAEAPTLILRRPLQSAVVRPAGKQKAAGADEEYQLPGIEMLDPVEPSTTGKQDEHIEAKREILERTLEEFGIAAQVVEIDRGPVITQFELELAPGVKIGKIVGLADDIARAMKAQSVRVVAPIPGKSTVGVEVPNTHRETVRLRALFESGVLDRKRMTLPLLLGRDASGEPLTADLAMMPHLLIAGATGSGKSVCMNSVIMTLLMTQKPQDVKLLLIDPKMVELSVFRDIPHLMAPVLTDMKKAAAVLEWATHKMDERYSFLAYVGARNIAGYNALGEAEIRKRLGAAPTDDLEDIPAHMPYIIIIVDELADLMMIAAKDVENSITRLAQKSRAVGIHLIVATQRPSVDVVTGLIKANMPSRVAFQASSKVDSRTILDRNGAEKLLGRGDMLFLPPGLNKLIRAQGAFTSDEEIRRITGFLQESARPMFDPSLVNPKGLGDESGAERDDLFDEAVRIVLETQRGSVSLLQRRLGIGYSRAARLIDIMADVGMVGDYKGSQAREVLYSLEDWEEANRAEQQSDGA